MHYMKQITFGIKKAAIQLRICRTLEYRLSGDKTEQGLKSVEKY